jgi:Tfp pilus assembly protein PilZ
MAHMFRSEPASGFKGVSVVCLGFVLGALLFLLPTLRTDSKVIERIEMEGQIVWATPAQTNPKGIAGRGLEYEYVVELPNALRVRVRDSAASPYRLGAHVLIERATRENGTQFYMFSRPANPYLLP